MDAVASVVIPAHNEEAVIARLLSAVTGGIPPGTLEIIVVANGCTDATAKVATETASTLDPSTASRVRVVSVIEASKREALRVGDALASVYPRLWVDADVVIGGADVLRLRDALRTPGVLAAGPARRLQLDGRSWVIRSYYDVWTRLPEARAGLFGRGVIAMTEEGHRRVTALPPVMGDDLAASIAFGPTERMVVAGAEVVVHVPRTVADLLRRRVRAMTSSAHVDQEIVVPAAGWGGTSGTRTHLSHLRDMVRAEPALTSKVATFLIVAAVARWRSRKAVRSGDFTTWLRDESSRLE